MVILDRVYDLTDYLDFHPGGYEILVEYAGTDATSAFRDKPHTVEASDLLEPYYIGNLIKV